MLISIGKVCMKGFVGNLEWKKMENHISTCKRRWRLQRWTPDPHPDPQAKRPSALQAIVWLRIKFFMAHVNIVAVL